MGWKKLKFEKLEFSERKQQLIIWPQDSNGTFVSQLVDARSAKSLKPISANELKRGQIFLHQTPKEDGSDFAELEFIRSEKRGEDTILWVRDTKSVLNRPGQISHGIHATNSRIYVFK